LTLVNSVLFCTCGVAFSVAGFLARYHPLRVPAGSRIMAPSFFDFPRRHAPPTPSFGGPLSFGHELLLVFYFFVTRCVLTPSAAPRGVRYSSSVVLFHPITPIVPSFPLLPFVRVGTSFCPSSFSANLFFPWILPLFLFGNGPAFPLWLTGALLWALAVCRPVFPPTTTSFCRFTTSVVLPPSLFTSFVRDGNCFYPAVFLLASGTPIFFTDPIALGGHPLLFTTDFFFQNFSGTNVFSLL